MRKGPSRAEADELLPLVPASRSASAAATSQRLKARSGAERIGFTQLAQRCILERLDEPSRVPAEVEAALATLRRFVSKPS